MARLADSPWFVAKDVCDALKIVNVSDALGRLDEDERGIALTDTPSGPQEMVIVSEGGLYTLVLRCRHRRTHWELARVRDYAGDTAITVALLEFGALAPPPA